MRVCLATETYSPQINGVSRTLGRLVDFLRRNGDEILLFTPRYENPDDAEGITRIDFPGFELPFYREITIPWVTVGRLRKELEEFRPDVVHVATEGFLGWGALRAARRLGACLVSSYHTNFSTYARYYRLAVLEPLIWKYLRWMHNAGRVTFCPTPSIREILLEKRFRNVTVWSRGIECERFHPKFRQTEIRREYGIGENDVVFLYAGRIAHEKNLSCLIRAFGLLEDDSPNTWLMLVGDGPARAALEKDAGTRVVFTGYQRGRRLSELYASAETFVFPSLTDTFGNVLLEGMASGLPAIGFDAPGPRDVIRPGQTGLVVPHTTPIALAEAMRELTRNPENRAAMAHTAREYALTQSWDAVNSVVRAGYEKAREEQQQALPGA